ncbi:MAG: TonB-dependent receptor [Gemmatimonadaceae bacterium]
MQRRCRSFTGHSARKVMRTGVAVLTLLASRAPLDAQQPTIGRIVGRVTNADRGPLSGAQVSVVGTSLGAVSGPDGRFRISAVPAGSHDLRVQRIGQQPRTMVGVVVRSAEETTVDVTLETAAVTLGGVVVSASRRTEKITDAPATITGIGPEVLDMTVGNTFASALKEAKGLDFIQVGMTSVAINARGFNSAFNNRFLMVEDGRISVIPESGLPIGALTPTPKVDLAGMEVLVGPGSALYGPDASNGVLSMVTKDPREFQGATIEVTGGSRSYRDVQGRYAVVRGNLGFKLSGEYQAAEDWENILYYNAGGTIVPKGTVGAVSEDQLKNRIDWNTGVMRGTGALVYYRGDHRLQLSGGMSRTDNVAQTNVGRNQLRDWDYKVLQTRYTTPHWYFSAYRTQSTSGSSFALNRYAGAQLTPANASLSSDSLRKLSDWPSNGRMYAAEAQGNYAIPALLNTAVVFGAQVRQDVVSSDRQWLTDRITQEDVKLAQQGVYAQTTTPVSRWLDVVLAGRVDDPENYDRQFSPKAGVIVKPWADQAFRITFNRAYKSPTILQTDFFIPDWTSVISIFGNTTGFTMQDASGNTRATFKALEPEVNKTWEVGYKGILANRLYLDGTYFRSNYRNFMSPLAIIGNPFATPAAGGATFAVPNANPGNRIPVNARGRIVNQANVTPIVLTYYNLGDARVSGADVGVSAVVTDKLELRGTVSTVKIDELTLPPGGSLEAASLNSPTTKWTMGATARNLGAFTAGVTFRNVNGYYFRSGTNTGVIPTFGTLDASLSYRLPAAFQSSTLSLSVANLFGCTAENVTYRTPAVTAPAVAQPNSVIASEERACGLGRTHREMINMPEIGTMLFLGVRFSK